MGKDRGGAVVEWDWVAWGGAGLGQGLGWDMGSGGAGQGWHGAGLCWTEPAPFVIPGEVVDCSAPVYGGRKGIATPCTKKLAKQHKLELGSVTGTGPCGRITPKDVEKAAGIVKSKAVEVAPDSTPMPAAAVANNIMESFSVLTFRVGYPVLTDALDALYDKVKNGVTMIALLAKATAMALVLHPVLKSTFGSLFVNKKRKELAEKARAKQLQPQEYNSGTFTLSNLGMFGVDRFDVILPPARYNTTYPYDSACDQGAIMAVGA
ncbi:Dihydrolipoyllysine-residue acetyltransferase component 4 of pyruvate dehydrogenase complex chloroplastic [Bienertia sinuspersici]